MANILLGVTGSVAAVRIARTAFPTNRLNSVSPALFPGDTISTMATTRSSLVWRMARRLCLLPPTH